MATKRNSRQKNNFTEYKDAGLLLMRAGLGVMFIYHGYPALVGGKEAWSHLGSATKYIGIHLFPIFWGLLSAIIETLGGVLLIVGFLFRPICILMILNLIVAAASHFGRGEGLDGAAHAIEDAIAFAGLLLIGPGRYSAGRR